MTALVHLNGPPAVGKSTIAQLLVDRRSLALNLDIDAIRVRLGQWSTHPDSKRVARSVGVATAAAHLAGGHDVVLPQLVERVDFIEVLERVALDAGAVLVEVMLVADVDELERRFLDRRRDLAASSTGHPQDDVPIDGLRAWLERTVADLERVVAARRGTVVVPATDADAARRAVEATLP